MTDESIPERIPIAHDDYHAKHVGRTPDGRQFFLTTPLDWCVIIEPGNYMAFYPPWEGDYDT